MRISTDVLLLEDPSARLEREGVDYVDAGITVEGRDPSLNAMSPCGTMSLVDSASTQMTPQHVAISIMIIGAAPWRVLRLTCGEAKQVRSRASSA